MHREYDNAEVGKRLNNVLESNSRGKTFWELDFYVAEKSQG
jgi:hypothetical protein